MKIYILKKLLKTEKHRLDIYLNSENPIHYIDTIMDIKDNIILIQTQINDIRNNMFLNKIINKLKKYNELWD